MNFNPEGKPFIPALTEENSLKSEGDGTSPLWKLKYEAQYGELGEKVRLIDQNTSAGDLSESVIEGYLDEGIDLGRPVYLNNGEAHTTALRSVVQDQEGRMFIRTDDKVYRVDFLG